MPCVMGPGTMLQGVYAFRLLFRLVFLEHLECDLQLPCCRLVRPCSGRFSNLGSKAVTGLGEIVKVK